MVSQNARGRVQEPSRCGMRVAYLNLAVELGGAERSLLDLIASMRGTAPDTVLALLVGSEGPFASAARDAGCRVEVVPAPPALLGFGDSSLKFEGRTAAAARLVMRAGPVAIALPGYVRRLHSALESINPTIVHSNDSKSHFLAVHAAGHVGVVWHVRDFLGSRRVIGRALAWEARRAMGAIAISEAVGYDAQETLTHIPIEVVYNAIDVDHYTPGDGDVRRLDELAGLPLAPSGAVRVGLVGTFGRWKGQDLFLEGAARIMAAEPLLPVRFYIVGGPIYRTKGSQFSEAGLKAAAAGMRLGDHVGFIGFQHETAWVYRSLDIVVHASTQPEPFGRTIVEAMACGRPVVAARSGGAAELFTHDLDAVGFVAGDAGALAAAIRSLVDDQDRRARIGDRARRTAVERFSRKRLGPDVLAAYRRFASLKGSGRNRFGRTVVDQPRNGESSR